MTLIKKVGECMSIRTTEKLSASAARPAEGNSFLNSVDAEATAAATFQAILAQKIDTIKETTEEMQAQKEELQTIKDEQDFTEIVRRVMPDGSVMITEYSDGKLVSRYRKKPHMISVPDEKAPVKRAPDGTPLIAQQPLVLKPSRSIASELFN